jgi:hypothetical protein
METPVIYFYSESEVPAAGRAWAASGPVEPFVVRVRHVGEAPGERDELDRHQGAPRPIRFPWRSSSRTAEGRSDMARSRGTRISLPIA